MENEPIHLEKNNRLAFDYINEKKIGQQYFHYPSFGADDARLAHIESRTYQREKLASVLTDMNEDWGAGKKTITQIERLKDTDSTVVIGGQQAGLLTGPMYTVNKIISIIKLANEKEAELKRPILPVFWIAGEDHDIDEINHIFSVKDNKPYKHTMPQQESVGKSVSDIELDQQAAKRFLQQFLNDLPETRYSMEWYEEVMESLEHSSTYTNFFARLIFQLFPDEGIILVDAHDKRLRELESDYFYSLLCHQQEITDHVYASLQRLQQEGYPVALDVEPNSANLFYHDEHAERLLLERKQEDWTDKHEEVLKTTAEMIAIAKEEPWRLSTNVVTRPIMQELLFPTLAFVAGDGEISYWATLKHAFETLGLEVPPVVPRLSLTYLTERTEKLLQKRALQPGEVIRLGTSLAKQNWLLAQKNVPLDTLFSEAKKDMDNIHAPLRDYAASISPDLKGEAEKNMAYIERQMDYFKNRMLKKMKAIYHVPLSHFDELETALRPNNGLQERMWNPYVFINQYGKSFLKTLIDDEHLSFHHPHYVVFLTEK